MRILALYSLLPYSFSSFLSPTLPPYFHFSLYFPTSPFRPLFSFPPSLPPLPLPSAHEDGVWGLAWTVHEESKREMLLTGAVDNTVKAWTWSVGVALSEFCTCMYCSLPSELPSTPGWQDRVCGGGGEGWGASRMIVTGYYKIRYIQGTYNYSTLRPLALSFCEQRLQLC